MGGNHGGILGRAWKNLVLKILGKFCEQFCGGYYSYMILNAQCLIIGPERALEFHGQSKVHEVILIWTNSFSSIRQVCKILLRNNLDHVLERGEERAEVGR